MFDRVGVMMYTEDVISDKMGFKTDIELGLSYTQCLLRHI